MSVRKRGNKWVVDIRSAGVFGTFDTKREADAFHDSKKVAVRQGVHVADSASVTVQDAAEIWISAVRVGRKKRGPAEASTLRQYRYHADSYIIPRIGKERLSRLTTARVVDFRDGLLEDISRPLAMKVLTSLKGILNEARFRGKIAHDPVAGVEIGMGNREESETAVPSVEDIKAILAKADELAVSKAWRRWRALLAVAIHTGMRASEIRGLPWGAVDLAAGQIKVYQRADENGVIGSPKTKSSRRKISLPPSLVTLLKAWKLESKKTDADALVFGTSTGKPESLSNIYKRAWGPVQAGRKAVNFHSLRHFHAWMLIRDNANPKEVQAELGHSSIQTTYDLYGGLFHDDDAEKMRKERAERMSGLLA